MKIEVIYLASEKLQKKLAIAGKNAERKQVTFIETDNALIIDKATINYKGEIYLDFQNLFSKKTFDRVGRKWNSDKKEYFVYIDSSSYIRYFDTIPTEQDLINILSTDYKNEEIKFREEHSEEIKEMEQKCKELTEEESKKFTNKHEETNNYAEELKKKKEKETVDWINEKGSERLKIMYGRKYEYKKTYEEERGKIELPEFIIDNEDAYEEKERANPSEKALLQEQEYLKKYKDVRIVLLREIPDYDSEEENEYLEAIRINVDWSRYSFYKFI